MRAVSDLEYRSRAEGSDPTGTTPRCRPGKDRAAVVGKLLRYRNGGALWTSPTVRSPRVQASAVPIVPGLPGCSNAAATPAHLPRRVASADALERTGSAVTRECGSRITRNHYARLTDLLTSNTTLQQRDHARKQITTTDERRTSCVCYRGDSTNDGTSHLVGTLGRIPATTNRTKLSSIP